ncbi:uncharacterized protein PAC_12602 [Phialocephala subalpina]|uniref:CHAT domain-containing protein n=1 Tax=Phialocephala subalpina TaxID=576137 RepID=A0A1L7XCG4_9HELO|nr:uncharacterized protein PAC_12602 [Phialocephala subalpina]
MSTSMNRGINTSLYRSLPAEAAQDVERAIWYKMTGQMDAGRTIFGQELKPFWAVTVVAIEHADLELEAGRWGAAWRILNARLSDAREAKEDLDTPEHRLLAITWAMVGIRHQGDLASAIPEIERTQHWLRDVPVEDYTDIQTSCIRRYVATYLFTKLCSKYENPEAEHIPMHVDGEDRSASTAPWSGLRQLRRSLCERGMFNEANALFRMELNRNPPEDREPVVAEFLSSIAKLHLNRGRDFLEASVRLQWANTYVLLQMLPRATEEIAKSELIFNRYCDQFDIANRESTTHMQALECEKLSCVTDALDKMHRADQLAFFLERVGSSKTGVCLSTAASIATVAFKVMSDTKYQDLYFDFQRRLEIYDETVTEDLCDVVQHRNELIYATISSEFHQQKSLEWINGFFQKYPQFSAPSVLASLYRSQAALLRSLRRIDESKQADERADKLDISGPSLGKWLHLGPSKPLVAVNDQTSPPENDSEDEDIDEPFFTPWKNAIGDLGKLKETSVNLVWNWALDDVTAGYLAAEAFQKMMRVPDARIASVEGTERQADIEKLRASGSQETYSMIFIKAAQEIVPQGEEYYNRICEWLSEPPKGHRNSRLFCLLMLRMARQWHLSDQHLWDLRVCELKHILELEAKLPQKIRVSFPHSKSSALAGLALSYHGMLDYVSDLRGQKNLEIVKEAEKYNELALQAFRQQKDRTQIALHQRTGAQLCIRKILRLEQLSLYGALSAGNVPDGSAEGVISSCPTEIERDIGRIRTAGLVKIKEADEINTDSALHASWSAGLDGITHRHDLAEFHSTAHNIYAAIGLLLAEPGNTPSQEAVSSIWKWVQKYKARSLARTIGMHSSDPPELRSQIMASPEARPAYEEMLRLQKQILEAIPIARFDLHRQMDAHLETMRETPLLRQLIELREGTPLNLPEIDAITEKIGATLVLVDWFYLPSFLAGEDGVILLFTARAGSEPTIDILTTNVKDILGWQATYIFPKEWKKEPEEHLKTPEARTDFDKLLGSLVTPLGQRTNRDEVLVFCPTDVLHRLPLHALSMVAPDPKDPKNVFSEALIHRNPIVYIHSHSLLRSCMKAAEHARYSLAAANPRFLSGIREAIPKAMALSVDDQTQKANSYTAGRENIRALARRFGTTPMIDESASKKCFLDAIAHSRLLHLHTHCRWTFQDPLDHQVEFPRAGGPPEAGTPLIEALTAREIFDIRVRPGTHVNLIACQGGVTQVKVGDEVMGLVPALLYSGVSSTVSTLWSIRDEDGAQFSNHFFKSYVQQRAQQREKVALESSGAGGEMRETPALFIDLAKAVQVAAKKMDHSFTAPLYSWAGFVLHGFWQFPISDEDTRHLRK